MTHYAAIVQGESGSTFAERMKEQALGAGVEIRYETVTGTKLAGDIKKVVTDKESYESKILILFPVFVYFIIFFYHGSHGNTCNLLFLRPCRQHTDKLQVSARLFMGEAEEKKFWFWKRIRWAV